MLHFNNFYENFRTISDIFGNFRKLAKIFGIFGQVKRPASPSVAYCNVIHPVKLITLPIKHCMHIFCKCILIHTESHNQHTNYYTGIDFDENLLSYTKIPDCSQNSLTFPG